MEIWLVRHGRTSANDEGRFQGWCDFPLNDAGILEAILLSRRLSSAGGFDLLLSSDLHRAWLTAKIISREIGSEPLSEPLLRECSWGYIEGLKRNEVETFYPFLFREEGGMLRALRCGGESERKLLARTRTLRKKIFSKHGETNRVLLVSHGRLINAFISGCMGFSSRHRWPYAPAPASLSIIKTDPGGPLYSLVLFNDTGHLRADSLNL